MDIVYSEKHHLHNTHQVEFEGNPFQTEELPIRSDLILEAFQGSNLGQVFAPTDHGLKPILAVHDRDYVEFLQGVYAQNANYYKEASPIFPSTFATRHRGRKPKSFLGLLGYYAFGWGSPILEGTWEAAYWSAQCGLTAADSLLTGSLAAYALCRPPGHHASTDLYGGFCYLNNAAISARYLQGKLQDARIAILDVDYHHGNGTQSIFYDDPSVLYCSLHAHPEEAYPYYWGYADEKGEGSGAGYNHNWPLLRSTTDDNYLTVLEQALDNIRTYSPGFLVVSAGFDIIKGDPVGGFELTIEGIGEIGKRIASLRLPTLVVQEGGYHLESLGQCAVTFLRSF